ncbi:hypothetical protein T12_6594 [Trichinella patagoniensis]|uniref:Uncharacterized protein n=1 Tax=Trichinella patagoniensis TaxID=990121 RepID=A0A0V1AFU7_9BILA|nr:hypothetical protein T12_6594 [Trichinella patagoniensis]
MERFGGSNLILQFYFEKEIRHLTESCNIHIGHLSKEIVCIDNDGISLISSSSSVSVCQFRIKAFNNQKFVIFEYYQIRF